VTPVTPVTQVIPPANSAVPEPGTWAMMLMGLFLIGQPVRRGRRAPRQPRLA